MTAQESARTVDTLTGGLPTKASRESELFNLPGPPLDSATLLFSSAVMGFVMAAFSFSAALNNLAIIKYNDLVSIAHGANALADNQACAASARLTELR